MKSQKTILSLLAIFTLVILSLSFSSAQTAPCIDLINAVVPSTVTNSQQTFQVTFDLRNTGNGCSADRNITSISLYSNLSGSSYGSWNNVLINPPINIAVGTQTSITRTFNIPSSGSGTLSTIVIVNSTTELGSLDSQSPYNFTLPSIQITTSSPTTSLSITGPSTSIVAGQNATITVKNLGTTTINGITLSETSGFGATFSPSSFSLTAGASQVTNLILDSLNNLQFGLNSLTVVANSSTSSVSKTLTVEKSFCKIGAVGSNLSITSVEWTNNGNGDDDSWELLDEIEVEVEVDNLNQDDDVDTVIILGLFDSSGKNIADDLIYSADSDGDDEEINVNIDDDDDVKVTFIFTVPADFDEGDYKLAVKAYSDDDGESEQCKDKSSDFPDGNGLYKTIKVETVSDKDKYIAIDNIVLDESATCNELVTGTFTAYNVGRDDEDRVKVIMTNKELGINQEFEFINMDVGDDDSASFSFTVPVTAQNKVNTLEFITQYDYKNGIYRRESDESYKAIFETVGCSTNNLGSGSSNALITASLSTTPRAGDELVVDATLSNTQSSTQTYTISLTGYSNWAELSSIDPISLSIEPGQTKSFRISMNVNEGVSGTQSFNIQANSNGLLTNQPVDVEIQGSNGFNLPGNGLIWIIGIINLVLIILIILVAVRLSRR